MQQQLVEYVFPPLASIIQEYTPVWLDIELIGYILDEFNDINVSRDEEYGLTLPGIEQTLMDAEGWRTLTENLTYLDKYGYARKGLGPLSDDSEDIIDIDLPGIAAIIYSLIHERKITSDDIQTITLVSNNTECPGVVNYKSTTITPSNGQYFTVIDITKGLSLIISCWKQNFGPRCEFTYPAIGVPVITSYIDGHLTLEYPMAGMY